MQVTAAPPSGCSANESFAKHLPVCLQQDESGLWIQERTLIASRAAQVDGTAKAAQDKAAADAKAADDASKEKARKTLC